MRSWLCPHACPDARFAAKNSNNEDDVDDDPRQRKRKGLWTLIEDDSLRETLGQANQGRVQTEYSAEVSADRYRRLYSSVLGPEIRR